MCAVEDLHCVCDQEGSHHKLGAGGSRVFDHDVARDCLSQQEAVDRLLTTRRVCDCLTHSRRLVCLCAVKACTCVRDQEGSHRSSEQEARECLITT